MTKSDTGSIKINRDFALMFAKTFGLPLMIAAIIGTGGYFGVAQVAPEPAAVERTATEVTEMKESLLRSEEGFKHLTDNVSRDISNLDKRIDDQQSAISDLEKLVGAGADKDSLEKLEERLRRMETELALHEDKIARLEKK